MSYKRENKGIKERRAQKRRNKREVQQLFCYERTKWNAKKIFNEGRTWKTKNNGRITKKKRHKGGEKSKKRKSVLLGK